MKKTLEMYDQVMEQHSDKAYVNDFDFYENMVSQALKMV